VPGGPDTAKMTPQQEKNIPKTGDFDVAEPSPAIGSSDSRIRDARGTDFDAARLGACGEIEGLCCHLDED
jgi:hypothetical protein